MTEFDFADAKPVKTTNTGKAKEPNPFLDIVQEIALKKDADGDPIAKAFTIDRNEDDDKHAAFVAKVKRQMSEAGVQSVPMVTVPVKETPAKLVVAGKVTGKDDPKRVVLTFWTVPRQSRPRKVTDTNTNTNTAE